MNRLTLLLTSAFAASMTALAPAITNAENAPSAFTAASLQAQFAGCGFQATRVSIQGPVAWVAISDQTDVGRNVAAFVYPDTSTAYAARMTAEMRESPMFDDQVAYSNALGPRLLPNYGPSTWVGNIALVQRNTLPMTLQPAATDSGTDSVDAPAANMLALPVAVDNDFRACLDGLV